MRKLFDQLFLLDDSSRISALDGVRGFSILFVLFFHFNPNSFQFLFGGHLGVDIFFVLSGYFISSILFNPNRSHHNYLKNRFFRLMPAYVFSLFVIWLLHFNLLYSYKGFIANLFFLPFFWKKIDYMNFVSWTLAWEWLFYFIAYFVLKLKKFVEFNNFFNTTLITLVIITISASIFSQNFEIVRFVGFYLGCLIYVYSLKIRNTYIQYISFGIILFQIFIYGYLLPQIQSWYFKHSFYLFFDFNVSVFLIALLHQETFLKNIFQSKPLLFLGKISYSFYLTHALIGIYFSTKLTNIFQLNFYMSCIITVLISIFIAALFFLISERPYFIYKLKKRNVA